MKARIIKRTNVDGRVEFVIQQRHFLFRWWWVDAWMNRSVCAIDSFPTLEQAQKHLCYFDGSKVKEEIIQNKMTPQEKAKELVYKFTQTNGNAFFTKECALIAVDEVLKLSNLGRSHNGDESQYDYWKEVKEHIINL